MASSDWNPSLQANHLCGFSVFWLAGLQRQSFTGLFRSLQHATPANLRQQNHLQDTNNERVRHSNCFLWHSHALCYSPCSYLGIRQPVCVIHRNVRRWMHPLRSVKFFILVRYQHRPSGRCRVSLTVVQKGIQEFRSIWLQQLCVFEWASTHPCI